MRVIDDVDKWSEMHGMKELNGHSKDLVVSSPAKVPSQLPVGKINLTHNMAAPARSSQEVVQQGSSNTQMEFRTKSGKRKITPMFLGPLESAPTTTFSSSSISTQNQLQSTSDSREPFVKRIAPEPAITNIQPTTSSVERSSMNVDESNLKRMGTFEPTASSASKRTRLYSASESLPVLSEKPILRSLPELYSVTATTSAETNKIIPLPEHKKQLKAHIFGQLSLNSTDTAQVDNEFSYSFNMKLSRISAKCNEKILWEAYTGNVISLIDANRFWITLTTFQSTLMVYRADAGRLEFELALDSPASALFLLDNYCLVVSSNGVISTWDLSEQRQLMTKSMVNLILGPESKITYKALTDAGLPVIGLDNSRFYVYSSSLDGWLIMQDTPEYDAKNAVSFEFVTKVNPGGILSKVLQGARLPPDVPVNILHSIEEGQLEKYMNTAKSTNSGLEYRLLLNLYVQHLVEDGRDRKLTDLINELNSTEKICGISTSKLLADINPLISKKKA
uniref:Protein HIRA-like C-terminal domain-containing protein n=1 Tax=Acrobeloides nanus TaxID=290746 RepID=A0A914CAD0_9BILA